MKKFGTLFFVMLLASCGYHLRGAIDLPPEMDKIYVQNASPPLLDTFRDILLATQRQLVSSAGEAGLVVIVLAEEMLRRDLSLSSTGKSTEYELQYTLGYEMLDGKGKILLKNQTIEINRDYFNAQANVIGKEQEEELIRKEMYRQAVSNIARSARSALKKRGKKK